ncbi:putative glycosyl transferase, family 14 [Helianthus annuus]|nr:putative glycosyl transferase, family 14 [Helianthus annuus]
MEIITYSVVLQMDILLSLRNTSNRVDTGALPPFQFSYLRNRKSLSEFWRDCPILADNSKEHNCMPYEHYTATLLAQKGLEGEPTNRSLTHTSWVSHQSKVVKGKDGIL